MKNKLMIGSLTCVCILGACGRKAGNERNTATGSVTSTPAASGSASAFNLAAIPSMESFLKSSSSAVGLRLADSATASDAPKFTAMADDLATYLTGDVSALNTAIATDSKNADWSALSGNLTSFFAAETKCGVMEHTARIVERLKEDSAPLCLLQSIGSVGDKVFTVASGDAIADLTQVFAQIETDKVLQIGLASHNEGKYEIVQIKGSASSPNNFHVVYSTCLAGTKKAFRQNILDIDRITGVISFQSLANGSLDDRGTKPDGAFSLSGYVAVDTASGVYSPDSSKARQVMFNESGLHGVRTVTAQAALALSGEALSASFFAVESDAAAGATSMSRTDKTALDVKYTGTGISDLVIYQGAGRSLLNLARGSITNTRDESIGFSFDATQTPQYATETSSDYLTNVAAVDFDTDAVLSQSAPTAPDVTAIDSSACEATPTTVLQYVDRPEDNSTFSAARASCMAVPADKNVVMCDSLREVEHAINDAMHADAVAEQR